MPGTWAWGQYTVHFDDDKTWSATDARLPDYQRMGGTWKISGDSLSLDYVGAAPVGVGGDATFTLSDDGRCLVARSGSAGPMRKSAPN